MFGLGGGEILVIVVIALVLFGKEDLPQTLKKMSKGYNEFKKVATDAQRSWNEVRDDVTRTIMAATEEDRVPPLPTPIIEEQAQTQSVAESVPAEGIHPEIGLSTGSAHEEPVESTSSMAAAPALPEIRVPSESVAVNHAESVEHAPVQPPMPHSPDVTRDPSTVDELHNSAPLAAKSSST